MIDFSQSWEANDTKALKGDIDQLLGWIQEEYHTPGPHKGMCQQYTARSQEARSQEAKALKAKGQEAKSLKAKGQEARLLEPGGHQHTVKQKIK